MNTDKDNAKLGPCHHCGEIPQIQGDTQEERDWIQCLCGVSISLSVWNALSTLALDLKAKPHTDSGSTSTVMVERNTLRRVVNLAWAGVRDGMDEKAVTDAQALLQQQTEGEAG